MTRKSLFSYFIRGWSANQLVTHFLIGQEEDQCDNSEYPFAIVTKPGGAYPFLKPIRASDSNHVLQKKEIPHWNPRVRLPDVD